MGSGTAAITENTVRYAPYLETYHKAFLQMVQTARFNAAEVSVNPYTQYEQSYYYNEFFSAGFLMSSYPSLYDMFGKFMAGLDVEVLYDEIFEDVVNGPVIDNLIAQESVRLTDELENEIYPRYEVGMRDINSVLASTFMIGKVQLETVRTKTLSRFGAETRYRVLPLVAERWKAHLDWNKLVIEMYVQIMKFAIIVKEDADDHSMEVNAKAGLWPFNAIQYETAAIGAVSGATNTHTDITGQSGSKAGRMIGGGMTGAASGAMIGASMGAAGGPIGAAIGGLVGFAAGLF